MAAAGYKEEGEESEGSRRVKKVVGAQHGESEVTEREGEGTTRAV